MLQNAFNCSSSSFRGLPLAQVDATTGYQTHHILCAPVLGESGTVLGVVQLINKRSGKPFGELDLRRLEGLCRPEHVIRPLAQSMAMKPCLRLKVRCNGWMQKCAYI